MNNKETALELIARVKKETALVFNVVHSDDERRAIENLIRDRLTLVAMVEAAHKALGDSDNHWHAGGFGEPDCSACHALATLDRLAAGEVGE